MIATRADLLRGVAADQTPLLAICGVTEQQARVLYERSLLWAYGQLGVDTSGGPDPMLTPQQSDDAPWLIDYFALRGLVRYLALQVDVATADQRAAYHQRFAQVQILLTEAEAAIEARGYGVRNLFTVGRLELDFLEPGPYLGSLP